MPRRSEPEAGGPARDAQVLPLPRLPRGRRPPLRGLQPPGKAGGLHPQVAGGGGEGAGRRLPGGPDPVHGHVRHEDGARRSPAAGAPGLQAARLPAHLHRGLRRRHLGGGPQGHPVQEELPAVPAGRPRRPHAGPGETGLAGPPDLAEGGTEGGTGARWLPWGVRAPLRLLAVAPQLGQRQKCGQGRAVLRAGGRGPGRAAQRRAGRQRAAAGEQDGALASARPERCDLLHGW